MNNEPLLEICALDFRIGKSEILNEVSFELNKGSILSLLGPNGSGKSTLLKLTSGIIPVSRTQMGGLIKYRGRHFYQYNTYERAQKIAYVPSDINVEFPISVYETVSLGLISTSTREDPEKIEWALDICRCRHLANRELRTLSGGERQLVILARALVQGAKILLLDETLSKMDLHFQAYVGKLLKDLTKNEYAFIIVSHDINMISEWSDQTVFLKDGRVLASGKTDQVFNEENIKKLYPSGDFFVSNNPHTGKPKIFFK